MTKFSVLHENLTFLVTKFFFELRNFDFWTFFVQNVLFWNEKNSFWNKICTFEYKIIKFYLNFDNEFVPRTTLTPKTKILATLCLRRATLNPKTQKSSITILIFKTRNDDLPKKIGNLLQKLHNLRSKIKDNLPTAIIFWSSNECLIFY